MNRTGSQARVRQPALLQGFELIQEFVDFFASLPEPGALFRGHANQAWPAIPSALRPDMYGIKSDRELARWKAAAGPFVDRPLSDLEWLVLAQHYGVPTVLLDWTTNPLIGLFFACQRAYADNEPADGELLVAYPSMFLSDVSYERRRLFEAWEGPPILFSARAMNKRSVAQDGQSSLHCEANAEIRVDQGNTFTVPADAKVAVLEILETLGIRVGTVFVDINSAARELADQLGGEKFVNLLAKGPYS